MGEVIITSLRGFWFLMYAVFLGASLWWNSANMAVDLHAQKRPADRSAIAEHRLEYVWFYAQPNNLYSAAKDVFPPLDDFQKIYKGELIDTRYLQPETAIKRLGIPIGILVLAFILSELLLWPIVRSRVARWLSTDSKVTFGRVKDLPLGDGFVLAEKVRLARNGGGNPHALTIGPSGNGKSACQVIPSLLQIPSDAAVVVTDPKGELVARCGLSLQKSGHPVRVLAPLAGYGWGWDPLRECASADDCRMLARQLLQAGDEGAAGQGGNWLNMSRTCLSAYLIQAREDDLGLADALQSLYADLAKGKALRSDAARLDYRQFATMAGSANTVGSVMATIQGSCQCWLMDRVVGWMNSPKQVRLCEIRKQRMALFLVTTASEMKETRPIQWLFFTRLFAELAKGGQNDVRIMLDEMANLGQLEGLDHALNLLRGAGVQLHAFVQNLSQLQQVYGPQLGAVVAESFGTVCVMSGLRKDADELGRLLGIEQDVRASHSTMDEKMRAQYSQNQKQAMEGAMLRQIRRDQVLIISGNCRPVLARMRPWFRIRKLKKRVMKAFQADWAKVPEAAKTRFFSNFPKIERVQIVLPELPEKKERPARKKVTQEPQEASYDELFGGEQPPVTENDYELF